MSERAVKRISHIIITFVMRSPDAARALDTARHDGFDERPDVFVLHRSLPF